MANINPEIKDKPVEIIEIGLQDTDSDEDDDPFAGDEDNQQSDKLGKVQKHNNKENGSAQILFANWSRDLNTAESGIKWFRCNQCEYKGKAKQKLIQHILFKHTDPNQMIDRMHNCKKCPKSFKRVYDLQRHILAVHEKDSVTNLKCSECTYECISSAQLKVHTEIIHCADFENLETLQCSECRFKTKFRKYLKEHIKKNHTDNYYQCEKCPYQTRLVASMRLHLIKHKEVKDEADLTYHCDKCPFKTYRCNNLKVHKLNHLKPEEIQFFYCYHCNFKAKRKDNLKTHVLKHFKREEITLACYICEFTTVKRHLLVNHIEKHSKEMSKMRNSGTKINLSDVHVFSSQCENRRIKINRKN